MEFRLQPSSGYADSYFDIQFSVSFNADRASIQIYNVTLDAPLEIIGVSSGSIQNETTIIVKGKKSTTGFINLFNKDKMNRRLRDFAAIDLRCEVKNLDTGEVETSKTTFYNQSKSLDSAVMPFDIKINDPTVDITNNQPLRILVTCDAEKKFELCVMSEDHASQCFFEIYTQIGQNEIEIPCELLWHDLNLSSNYVKKFDMYWVKFEGVDFNKFMNRKYILIENTRLHFNSRWLMPPQQTRNGPTGIPLSSNFILSNKYFVHTWKGYSTLTANIDGYGAKRLDHLTRFMHEAQNMQTLDSSLKLFSDNTSDVKLALREQSLVQKSEKKGVDPTFLQSFAKQYTQGDPPKVTQVMSASQSKPAAKKEGCGCSRKT